MCEDFAREGVVRYDVAYMATAVTATPFLHMQAQQAKHSVIALEAHGDGRGCRLPPQHHRRLPGSNLHRGCWGGLLC
jgi:hypothetical protein